jgi:hypothetical protein
MSQSAVFSVRAQALPARLRDLAVLAALLERIERDARRPDPEQYRQLVDRIRAQLQALPMDAALDAMLAGFPATAEIYENLRYELAGLCRAPLAHSVGTERAARDLLSRVGREPPDKY